MTTSQLSKDSLPITHQTLFYFYALRMRARVLRMYRARWLSTIHAANNALKFLGFQTGAADKCAVDFREVKEFGGIVRFYRAAIENAQLMRAFSQPLYQAAADMGMHRRNVCAGRRLAGADRPDGFIGDHRVGRGGRERHAALDLAGADMIMRAVLALALGFADADDGGEPRAPGVLGLGRHIGVALAVIVAPLAMAHDYIGGAGVPQHLGRDIAGKGAARFGVAILAAQRESTLHRPRRLGNERERRADQHLARQRLRRQQRLQLRKLDQAGRQAVHLPVSSHQWAHDKSLYLTVFGGKSRWCSALPGGVPLPIIRRARVVVSKFASV